MKKENLKNTTNNRIYKLLLTQWLGRHLALCSVCSPHKGCNYWNARHDTRSWKGYRKTQHKIK